MAEQTIDDLTTRERKRIERWDRVVTTALRLAGSGGYEAVQMRDVATEAEVAIGTLYRYFGSKDELLLAGLARWATEVCERIAAEPIPGATAADRVAAALREATEPIETSPTLMAALVTAMASPVPGQPHRQEAALAVHSLIRTAIGADPDGVDVDGVVRVVGHVWFSAIVSWVAGRPRGDGIADELEVAVRLLLPDRR
jgi:TetR/AcrR family transcriptional regulator, cholesterol catabolism regulator